MTDAASDEVRREADRQVKRSTPRAPSTLFFATFLTVLPWLTFGLFVVLSTSRSLVSDLDVAGVSGWRPIRPLSQTFSLLLMLEGLLALFGVALAISAARRLRAMPREERPAAVWLAALMAPLAFLTAFGSCMMASGLARGRQLRDRGRVRLPVLDDGHGGTKSAGRCPPAHVPEGVADAWRDNARTEEGSVTAFVELARDLEDLGAPRALVDDARADAEEEREHTGLCVALAQGFDGTTRSPRPIPPRRARARVLPRRWRLARLAAEALVDGALLEGSSARIAGRLARCCADDEVRAGLRAIARDEVRHARHGWDVVTWCVREGGFPVVLTLLATMAVLPRRAARVDPRARFGAWEPWGLASQATVDAAYREERELTLRRCREILAHAS